MKPFPVMFFGKENHKVSAGTIHPEDLNLILFTDSVEEAMAHIEKYTVEPFGLKRRKLQPINWLGEFKV